MKQLLVATFCVLAASSMSCSSSSVQAGTASGPSVPDGHGGRDNEVGGLDSFIGGGYMNTTTDDFAVIAGGEGNLAGIVPDLRLHTETAILWATIGGGYGNMANGTASTVSGGLLNTAAGIYSTISGGQHNLASNHNATISGGFDNVASGYQSTIGGGYRNTATGLDSTIAGGFFNSATDDRATVGGGHYNSVSGGHSTIAGGLRNTATQSAASIGGGIDNTASDSGTVIAGGLGNTASGRYSSVGGGEYSTASGRHSVVSGGERNVASGDSATVPGGGFNTASGDYSFVAGSNADDLGHANSFVWGGATGARTSAGPDTFNIWATTTEVHGYLTLNGRVMSLSDRNMKEAFSFVNAREVLDKVVDMPVSTWRFKSEDDSVRHIGPMAQDFMAAFGFGTSDRHIVGTDADGVALAAIQGLYAKLEDTRAELAGQAEVNTALRWHNAQLRAILRGRDESYEARFARLEEAFLLGDD